MKLAEKFRLTDRIVAAKARGHSLRDVSRETSVPYWKILELARMSEIQTQLRRLDQVREEEVAMLRGNMQKLAVMAVGELEKAMTYEGKGALTQMQRANLSMDLLKLINKAGSAERTGDLVGKASDNMRDRAAKAGIIDVEAD